MWYTKRRDENIISLQKCYDYFNRFKMKRRIMKLIKRNLDIMGPPLTAIAITSIMIVAIMY